MPLRRPFRKLKAPKKHSTYFSDQVIENYSVVHYPCELYFPEPSLTFDEFGAVKDVCLSGDLELVWSKYCVVHLCKIPDVPNDSPFTLEDTGQENQVCFNVVLNRNKGGNYSYVIRDELWHEYSHKVGTAWRRFLLQFNVLDQQQFDNFEQTINSILQEVNENKIEEVKTNITYLLIAVQSDNEKRKSNLSENRHSRRSLYDLKEIESKESDRYCNSDSGSSDIENSSVGKEDNGEISLAPPFAPAPYEIFGLETEGKVEIKEDSHTELIVTKSINLLCDSLHIHPNELPQTLESLLKSTTTIRSREVTPNLESPKSAEEDTKLTDTDGAALKSEDDSERLTSENLKSEDLYVPMRLVTRSADKTETAEESGRSKDEMSSPAVPSSILKKAEEIAHGLEAAINNSDLVKAQEYAKELTLQNVTCRVTDLKIKEQSPNDKEKEFSLKVNIEDKDSSGSSIMLRVRSTDTIRDLKNRMLIKHMFPVEVQYWIIGKRIPQDTETLEKCRIKTHGYTAFLYLVSAKSAGINKEEFTKKQALLKNPDYIAGEMAPMPSPGGGHTLGSSKGSATPGINSGPSPGAKAKKEPGISRENFNLLKAEKRTPEKLQGQGPNMGGYSQGQVLQQTGPEISNALGQVAAGYMVNHPVNAFSDTPFGQSKQRVAVMHPQEDEEVPQGWTCPSCTYFNQPTRPGCEICATDRPDTYEIPADYVITDEEKMRLEREEVIDRQTREAQERERLMHAQELQENYAYLQQADAVGVITNTEQFTCPICFDDIGAGEGVVLRECLHTFCRDCLCDAVQYNEEPVLKCPFVDNEYSCNGVLQDREVKGLVSQEAFAKYLARSLSTAESQAQNSFHCKTADCPGWCIYEDHVNFFVCQVCRKENCLTCKAIHQGMNCKQYQEDLKLRAVNDKAANKTQIMIRKMLDDGDAMNCPQCQVIVMKKEGCDWIQCSICKTEICWVTKGRRWGPLGNGDISGGCGCRINGDMCHPDCNNCH